MGRRLTTQCFGRLTRNDLSFPVGLPGGPAIQFGGFQGYFLVPTELDSYHYN